MKTSATTAEVGLDAEITRFKTENPELAEALEVFGVSYAEYEQAIAAQNDVTTVISNHTIIAS